MYCNTYQISRYISLVEKVYRYTPTTFVFVEKETQVFFFGIMRKLRVKIWNNLIFFKIKDVDFLLAYLT